MLRSTVMHPCHGMMMVEADPSAGPIASNESSGLITWSSWNRQQRLWRIFSGRPSEASAVPQKPWVWTMAPTSGRWP